ncbi:uncharacterized protein [Blastocystis hominis]|uniref:Transcription factor CBF/NF-Y/archaeal histone domain-containing protein n=1 Tax=Blastocystis hominis TaxID=12968 RepID=D8LZY7_BLAHO|nr:uncharacterized protein [Blastocystis hominis]CBK21376.2 unnamed protein product [Blastocystis hominis]|eukprot:XP_012895424.1 uncharacterized protein [Blastocystis hominis]
MEKDDDKKKTTIPLKTVNTIIRDVLGDKIKDIWESFTEKMQECGNAFISHLAMELTLQAENDKVKTIGDDQVMKALSSLGFEEMKDEVKKVGKEKSHTPRKRSMLVVDEHTVNKLVKITPEKSLIVCLILTEVRLD